MLLKLLRPTWVVTDEGDFGLRIFGVVMTYYKDHAPLFYDKTPQTRPVRKREFGEVIRSELGHPSVGN
jgi:hypothetical protein